LQEITGPAWEIPQLGRNRKATPPLVSMESPSTAAFRANMGTANGPAWDELLGALAKNDHHKEHLDEAFPDLVR
jgi:hypothetical protein